MSPLPDRRFLSVADAAELLGSTPAEVAALCASGELPAIRIHGSWRIEELALEQWISDRYEIERRQALWQQSQDASIVDLFGKDARPGEQRS